MYFLNVFCELDLVLLLNNSSTFHNVLKAFSIDNYEKGYLCDVGTIVVMLGQLYKLNFHLPSHTNIHTDR